MSWSAIASKAVSPYGAGILAVVLVLSLYLLRGVDGASGPLTARGLERLTSDRAFEDALETRGSGWTEDLKMYLLTALEALQRRHGLHVKAIAINRPLEPDNVNIYFAKVEKLRPLAPFAGSCSYLGVHYTVVCDLKFIDAMQLVPSIKGKDQDADFASIVQAGNANVLLWLLGHELGHLAHGDGAHNFNGAGRSDFLARFRDAKEVAADRFSVELFQEAGLDPKYGLVFGSALSRGLHAFINKLGNEILSDNRLPLPLVDFAGKIPVRARSMRDALFARAVTMQILVNEKYDIENTKYYDSIRDRIQLVE